MYKLIEVKLFELEGVFYTGQAIGLFLEIETAPGTKLVTQKMFCKSENYKLQQFLKENNIKNFKELCKNINETIKLSI